MSKLSHKLQGKIIKGKRFTKSNISVNIKYISESEYHIYFNAFSDYGMSDIYVNEQIIYKVNNKIKKYSVCMYSISTPMVPTLIDVYIFNKYFKVFSPNYITANGNLPTEKLECVYSVLHTVVNIYNSYPKISNRPLLVSLENTNLILGKDYIGNFECLGNTITSKLLLKIENGPYYELQYEIMDSKTNTFKFHVPCYLSSGNALIGFIKTNPTNLDACYPYTSINNSSIYTNYSLDCTDGDLALTNFLSVFISQNPLIKYPKVDSVYPLMGDIHTKFEVKGSNFTKNTLINITQTQTLISSFFIGNTTYVNENTLIFDLEYVENRLLKLESGRYSIFCINDMEYSNNKDCIIELEFESV